MSILKCISRLEVCTHIKKCFFFLLKRLSPSEMSESSNALSIKVTSAVHFIVGWWLFAFPMNSAFSILCIVQS